jgi:hypothetical protein
MVSPPDKESGQAGRAEYLLLGPTQATPDGDAITFVTPAAFGADPQSASGGSQYVSRRSSAGWTTENISPPDQEGFIAPPVRGFTEDLGTAAIAVSQPPLVPGAPEGFENLYLRDGATGAISLLTDQVPRFGNTKGAGYCAVFEGASADYGRIFFAARGALTPEAPVVEEFNLYEWSAAHGIQLVSVLPNGKPAATGSMGYGQAGSKTSNNCEVARGENLFHGAISADGSLAYWSRKEVAQPSNLYVRVDGTETVQIDKTQGGGGPAGNGEFWGASKDGSVAFFTAPGKLTSDAGENALYRYDLKAEAGKRLRVLTPGPGKAEVLGVSAISEDGSRVYFAARGVLAPGAQAGLPNLYLWEEGTGLRFIATLSEAATNRNDWSKEPGHQTARSTPDGSALAFLSTVPLTGFDNTDQQSGEPDPEAYLYEAASGRLSCVSCNPSGARPIGPASLPTWPTPFQQPRYLSVGGERMFFMTKDALSPTDTNSRQDVYEFERAGVGDCTASLPTWSAPAEGCIRLISTGEDQSAAVFIDASEDGDDVFFGTPQRLVTQDTDDGYDIYDASKEGGFPPVPPAAAECSGESCRAPALPPAPPSPGSSTLTGQGNVNTKPHKKKPHHKKKHHKKQHQKRKHQKKMQGQAKGGKQRSKKDGSHDGGAAR